MLDGLEITELSLEDILKDNQHLRIDSEYFKKEFINFYLNVPNIDLLGSFVEEGYRVVYENTKILNKEEAISKNFPIFLQATDLQTPFIKKDNFYYVDEKDWVRYPMGRIKSGELLIEVKGKIEKVAIVSNDFPEKVLVSGSLYKMTVRDTINKYYLLVYLISKYGSAFKDRSKTNLLIPFLSKDDLFNIPIPIFSNLFQTLIETLIKNANIYSEESQKVYKAAETLLLTELDLQDFKPTEGNTSVRTIEDSFLSSWRLDAEYYQPKYDELEKKCRENALYVKIVKDIRTFNRRGLQPNYAENGDLDIINSRHILATMLDYGNFEKTNYKNWKTQVIAQVQYGDILTYTTGANIGRTHTYLSNENALASNHVNILRIENENAVYVAFVINSIVGQYQTEKLSAGSAQQELYPKDIDRFYIPFIKEEYQTMIEDKVIESRLKNLESKRLLNLAKTAVEIAIEENEEMAIQYIQKETDLR